MEIYVQTADSLCCMAKLNKIVESKYTAIKKKEVPTINGGTRYLESRVSVGTWATSTLLGAEKQAATLMIRSWLLLVASSSFFLQ